MWFIKVILLGAPRLGKTTARRRLTGEIKDISSSGEATQPSTGAVESAPRVIIRNLTGTTALVTPAEWTASKNLSDEAKTFIQFFCSQIEKKGVNPKLKQKEDFASLVKGFEKKKASSILKKTQKFMKQNRGKKYKADPSGATNAPAFQGPDPMESNQQFADISEIADLFHKAMDPKQWDRVKHLFTDSAFLKMEDTGGQPEFMDMLPALTIGPALYLLFCKLTEELDSCYAVSYLSPSGETTEQEISTYTFEEVLLSALASISCFKSYSSAPEIADQDTASSSEAEDPMSSCTSSLAYIVGTHKDKVSEEQIDEFDKKLQDSIRSTDFFHSGLVKFASEKRMVLPIDNMNGGESEIKKIQKFLEEGMKQHFKKIRIPAAWLVLSLCLRKREKRTATIQSVRVLAGDLGMSSKEVTSALLFLHHYAGVLMYFPEVEELWDMVICDTQVVYDSATNLIVNSFKFGKVSKAASERFRETGQFSLEDIKGATQSVSGDYIPLQKLVKLLEHLNIIAPLGCQEAKASPSQDSQITYFMPCVLQNLTHESLNRWWAKASDSLSPSPLFIRYKCGFIPIGVFPAMIASLASNTSISMIYTGIMKNRVQFRIGDDFDTVTLISHPKYYGIHLSRMPDCSTPTRNVCSDIRQLVESTLKKVTSQMNYSFHVEYQLAFECPTHPGREHLCIVESSPKYMRCLNDMKDPQPKKMQRQHLVWLEQAHDGQDDSTATVETFQHELSFTDQPIISQASPSVHVKVEQSLESKEHCNQAKKAHDGKDDSTAKVETFQQFTDQSIPFQASPLHPSHVKVEQSLERKEHCNQAKMGDQTEFTEDVDTSLSLYDRNLKLAVPNPDQSTSQQLPQAPLLIPALTTQDHPQVTKCLRQLLNEDLISVGTTLGLNYVHLKRMPSESLCDSMVHAWLRKDDNVLRESGQPCWESLVKAMETVGLNGIASEIKKEKC